MPDEYPGNFTSEIRICFLNLIIMKKTNRHRTCVKICFVIGQFFLFTCLLMISCKKTNDGTSSSGSGTNGTNGNLTVLAGNGTDGFVDGSATAAEFSGPEKIALDGSGNLYVADYSNNRIRKVSPAGDVTTLAGSGTGGTADGTGANAQFTQPRSVAVDAAGNVFVCDYNNEDIRKITPAGIVTTIAGQGFAGYQDGMGTSAAFDAPTGIVVDPSDNLFVTDLSNARIRKITSDGLVSTFAGDGGDGYSDGTGTAAEFNLPKGIALDASGNLYITDSGGERIRKISPAGVVTTVAGDGQDGSVDGPAAKAEFYDPGDIVVDNSGNLYVADVANDAIRKITAAGVVSTIVSDSDGISPVGLAIDATGSTLYISDGEHNQILKMKLK
jgi:serine/threonine protein kinase, bacterial